MAPRAPEPLELVSMFLEYMKFNDVPSNDQDVLLLLWLAFDGKVSSSILDVLLLGLDVHRAILLDDLELVERVEGGSIFNVTSRNAEASLIDQVSQWHCRVCDIKTYHRAMGK